MLAHDNVVASVESFHRMIPPMEHRIVSLLPLSHLLEQSVGLYYALSVGADILYVRSRNPRVIFDALRDHRVTSMVVVPQVLDLFWSAIEREVAKRGRETAFERLRGDRPAAADRLAAAPVRQRPQAARAATSGCSCRPAPSCRRRSSRAGRTSASRSSRATARPRPGRAAARRSTTTASARSAARRTGIEMRIVEDGEIQFRGPTVFRGYWKNPTATAEAFTDDGWYRTGDIGHLDPAGRLILSGRKRDMIVLPNGFNVYPEDIENALRIAGIRDSVVLETEPGRIEAVVLGSATGPPGAGAVGCGRRDDPAAVRERLDAAVKAANATLGPNQRIAGWRLWPDEDFPRTHTSRSSAPRSRPGSRPTGGRTSPDGSRQFGTG